MKFIIDTSFFMLLSVFSLSFLYHFRVLSFNSENFATALSLHNSLQSNTTLGSIDYNSILKSKEVSCHVQATTAKLDLKVDANTYKNYTVRVVLSVYNLSLYYNDQPIKVISLENIENINEVPKYNNNPRLCIQKCLELIVSDDQANSVYKLEYFTLCFANSYVKFFAYNTFRKMQTCHYQLIHGRFQPDLEFTNNITKINSTDLNVTFDKLDSTSSLETVNLVNTSKILDSSLKVVTNDFQNLNKLASMIKKKTIQPVDNILLDVPQANTTVVQAIANLKKIVQEEELIKDRLMQKFKVRLSEAKKENDRMIIKDDIIDQIAKANQKVRQKMRKQIDKKNKDEKVKSVIDNIAKNLRKQAQEERQSLKNSIDDLINDDNERTTQRGRELLIKISNIERKIPFDYRLCYNKKQIFRNKTRYFEQLCKEIYTPDLQSEYNCNQDENFCKMCCDDHPFTNSLPSEYCESNCLNIIAKINAKREMCGRKIRKARLANLTSSLRTSHGIELRNTLGSPQNTTNNITSLQKVFVEKRNKKSAKHHLKKSKKKHRRGKTNKRNETKQLDKSDKNGLEEKVKKHSNDEDQEIESMKKDNLFSVSSLDDLIKSGDKDKQFISSVSKKLTNNSMSSTAVSLTFTQPRFKEKIQSLDTFDDYNPNISVNDFKELFYSTYTVKDF